MKNQGFTLIETVVVSAILSILALAGVESIISFQKTALLESTADEFASTLRTARTKSIAGEILEGKKPEDFATQGLPKYGVRVDNQNYFLFIDYQFAGEPSPRHDNLETFTIDNTLSLIPLGEIVFERVTSEISPMTFTLQRKDNQDKKEIDVDNKGVTLK